MPLVLDPSQHPPERLRAMLVDAREGLAGLLEWVHEPPAPVKEPLGLRTAEDLLAAAIFWADQVPDDEQDTARLAAVVNLAYEVQLAAIDIAKMHLDMPKVPQGRK